MAHGYGLTQEDRGNTFRRGLHWSEFGSKELLPHPSEIDSWGGLYAGDTIAAIMAPYHRNGRTTFCIAVRGIDDAACNWFTYDADEAARMFRALSDFVTQEELVELGFQF